MGIVEPTPSLADLLELWHDTPDSFRTLRAVVRRWEHTPVTMKAFDRYSRALEQEKGGSVVHFGTASAGEPPETTERITRLWLELPDRLREESDGGYPQSRVRAGAKEWHFSEHMGAVEREAREPLSFQDSPLVFPLALAPGLELEPAGAATVAGREGWRVRAVPRAADALPLHLAGAGADEYELVVEQRSGIVLRIEARLDGQPFAITEFVELELDVPLDPRVFIFVSPTGEPVRTQEELDAALNRGARGFGLTVEEAARRVDFTVYVPVLDWAEPRLHVSYLPEIERPPMSERVALHYSDDFARRQFTLQQSCAPAAEEVAEGFEPLDLDGLRGWIAEPEAASLPTTLRLVKDETLIELSGHGLDRSELIEIARSLVPGSTEPPDFG